MTIIEDNLTLILEHAERRCGLTVHGNVAIKRKNKIPSWIKLRPGTDEFPIWLYINTDGSITAGLSAEGWPHESGRAIQLYDPVLVERLVTPPADALPPGQDEHQPKQRSESTMLVWFSWDADAVTSPLSKALLDGTIRYLCSLRRYVDRMNGG